MPIFSRCKKVAISTEVCSGVSRPKFTKIVHDVHCVSKKNDNDVAHYNFNAHKPILVIFCTDVAE